MNAHSSQSQVDARNLLFTIGVLVVVLLLLAVLIEKKLVVIKPQVIVKPQETEKLQVITRTPIIPMTTVNIRPLVTKFPPLPDFNSYHQIDKKKAAFIDYLTPIVEYQNGKILKDREHLKQILRSIVNAEKLSDADRKWLEQLAEKYDVDWNNDDHGSVVINLASRVDIIPVSLALVQAAKESSWGQSRYAVQVNNLFGQWCYDAGCGVIPGERAPDAIHEVRKFKTVNDATRSYIHNLNTHPQYAILRQLRQRLRIHHKPIVGSALADGLLHYSERRYSYVDEVKSMIRQYHIFQERRAG